MIKTAKEAGVDTKFWSKWKHLFFETMEEQEEYNEVEEIRYHYKAAGGVIPDSTKGGSYYVYIVSGGGMPDSLTYIGSGKGDRYKHALSGVSNNYILNKLHHTGEELYTIILKDNLTQDDSLLLEKQLIAFYNPVANTAHKTKMLYRKHGRSPYEAGFKIVDNELVMLNK